MPVFNGAAVADTVIAFKKGITLQQGRALRDNPLAIAEGSAGAPYLEAEWHPYNSLAVGDSNTGQIWSFAADGAVATIETPDFVDGYEYRLRFDAVSHSTGFTQEVRLELYRAASLAYAAPFVISDSFDPGDLVTGQCGILQARAVRTAHAVDAWSADVGLNATVAKLTYNHVVSHATAQRLLRARLSWTLGNFDAGAVFLDRRRYYA